MKRLVLALAEEDDGFSLKNPRLSLKLEVSVERSRPAPVANPTPATLLAH